MNINYFLMHKDIIAALVSIDTMSGSINRIGIENKAHLPLLGRNDHDLIKTWWEHRAVPGEREDIKRKIREAGFINTKEYMVKNLAVSVTDAYWICPAELDLSWDDVKISATPSDKDRLIFHNANSYDPNASLGGRMNKYWDLSTYPPVLVKKASDYYGQQNVNELFATELHRKQNKGIAFVEYEVERAVEGGINSRCRAFTTEQAEFVPAYEVLNSRRLRNSVSQYDEFINICEEHGLDRGTVRDFLDYQTLTDFVMTNTDRHFMNFGVLRDPDTLGFISPAPIFDTGNSMFFTEFRKHPFDREEVKEIKISGFHSNESKLLQHVKNKGLIDLNKLPSPDEVREFYLKYGIPEEKTNLIAGSYAVKIGMLSEIC